MAIIKTAEPNKDRDLFLCCFLQGGRVECDYAVDLNQSQGLIGEFEENHGWVKVLLQFPCLVDNGQSGAKETILAGSLGF